MKYELLTIEGKKIRLTDAAITVSVNPGCKDGFAIFLRVEGVLPGCRKSEVLTYSFDYKGNITFTTLFGYRKHHAVKPEILAEMIKIIPVVSQGYYGKCVITPELEFLARSRTQEICTCCAVTNYVKGEDDEF